MVLNYYFVSDIILLEEKSNEWKIKKDTIEVEYESKLKKLNEDLDTKCKHANDLEELLENKSKENYETKNKVQELEEKIFNLVKEMEKIESEKSDCCKKITELTSDLEKQNQIFIKMKNENERFVQAIKDKDLGKFIIYRSRLIGC